MSQVAGVIQWVGDDRVVDEDKERQVGQEVHQVKGADMSELASDSFFVILVDASSL